MRTLLRLVIVGALLMIAGLAVMAAAFAAFAAFAADLLLLLAPAAGAVIAGVSLMLLTDPR